MAIQAERLKELITELKGGGGLRPVAKAVGVAPNTIKNWLLGSHLPDRDSLYALADIKGWTLDEMVSYLEGETLPAHAEISMPAFREAAKKWSATQALEAIEMLLPIVRQSHLDVLPKSARIAFLKGADTMSFSQLLQAFLATVPPETIEELLVEKRLQKSRLGELVAGAYPTNEDLKKVGAMMRSADFRDAHDKPYTIDRLEAIRAGSTITNGANR